MNNASDSSTQWPGWHWQLAPTNNEIDKQLWLLLLMLLLFCSFLMLRSYIDWAHWGTTSQTRDQAERNGGQTAVPYHNLKHEASGAIGRDRLGIHVGHAQMDPNDTRISGVRRPPQGNPSTLVNDRNSNQQRRIQVFTIDRWGFTTESDPHTECMD